MVSGLTPPDKKRDFSELSDRVDGIRDTIRFKGATTGVVDTGFGFGASSPEVAPISGLFTLEPSIHNIGVELSWTGATGVIDGGDTVDSDSSIWQGKFGNTISGTDLEGTGFIENLSTTIITDVPQTLNIGSSWTGAVYTTGTLKENTILLTATSVLLDDINGDPILKWIRGKYVDGAIVLLKPVNGKSITLTTGGNIDIGSDISIGDSSFALMQFHIDNINQDPLGTWSVVGAGGGGGGGGGSGAGTWKSPCRVASTVNNPTHPIWSNNIDSTSLVEGDRFLVKDQDTARDNGIYVVGGILLGLHTATRAKDFDTNAEVVSETFVAIEEGNTHAEQLWHLITINPLTVGSTDQVWQQFGASAGGSIQDGTEENQHLEWEDTLKVWQARTNLEFGATGPHANAGAIRFPNGTALVAWRNQLDDGNIAIKVTSDDYFDITHDPDTLFDTSLKFRIRAQSPFSAGYPNPAFEIIQLPDDNLRDSTGLATFSTTMRYPATLNIWRWNLGGALVFTLDQNGDIDHHGNGEYKSRFYRFFSFGDPLGSGDGSQISRFGPLDASDNDADGSLGGLHYDIENPTHSHNFRVGDGSADQFSVLHNPPITKWRITADRNITTQPIEFSYRWFDSLDEADHVGPVSDPRIFRSVEGMYIQLGVDGGGGGGFGSIKFIDNTGLTSFTDDGRVNFDFDRRRTKFNFLTGGFHLRTNNDGGSSVIFYPPFSDHSISHLEVNDAVFSVIESSIPAGGLVFMGGGAGINQLMRLSESQANIYQKLDMSKRADLSSDDPIEGSDIFNTRNITPFVGDLADIGHNDNRYRNMYADGQVFAPIVGEIGSRTEYISVGLMKHVINGFGSYVVEINGDVKFTVDPTISVFRTPLVVNSSNNNFNYFQLYEKFADPSTPIDRSGRLFSKEASGSTEIHPWWIGDDMAEAVDLMTSASGDFTTDIDLNCNNIGFVGAILFCTQVQIIDSVSTGLEYVVGFGQSGPMSHLFQTPIGSDAMEIFTDRVDFKNHFLEDVNSVRFGGVGLLKSIASSGDNLFYATNTSSGRHVFTIDGAPYFSLGEDIATAQPLVECFKSLELNNNTIQGVNDIFFEDPNISFETFSAGLIYSVPLSHSHIFIVGNEPKMTMFAFATIWENIQIYGDHYHDYTSRLPPSGASFGVRRLFVDQENNDELSVVRTDGAVISLEQSNADLGGEVRIKCQMAPQSRTFPDTVTMLPNGIRVSGIVMPNVAQKTFMNAKCTLPLNVAGTPNMRVIVEGINLQTATTDTVVLRVSTQSTADDEVLGALLVNEVENFFTIADVVYSRWVYVRSITATDQVSSDIITIQIRRDSVDGNDTFSGNILVTDVFVEVDTDGL